jgi:hypothetical protein
MGASFRTTTTGDVDEWHQLDVLDTRERKTLKAQVVVRRREHERVLSVLLPDGRSVIGSSSRDFEESLQLLRNELESNDLLLLCNRYRMNAFASSMSRQMSDGLACYIVDMGHPVDPEHIADALAPAPAETIVSADEANEYIAAWIESVNG